MSKHYQTLTLNLNLNISRWCWQIINKNKPEPNNTPILTCLIDSILRMIIENILYLSQYVEKIYIILGFFCLIYVSSPLPSYVDVKYFIICSIQYVANIISTNRFSEHFIHYWHSICAFNGISLIVIRFNFNGFNFYHSIEYLDKIDFLNGTLLTCGFKLKNHGVIA